MRVKSLAFTGTIIFVVLLNACGGNAQVDEKAVSNSTVAEEIYINNCGNPASAKQVSQHSQSVAIQGGVGLGFDIKELAKGSVEAKYTSTNGVVKSQEVTAAPDTNMKFVLLWTEQVSEGTVTVSGYSGQATYRVSIPISVQQTSAVDMGCLATPSISSSTVATPIPVLPEVNNLTSIIAAAKNEGALNVIALPHDWCNYGEVISAFKAKYDIQINEINPDAGSADEIVAIRENSGSQAPDVIDVGLSWGDSAKNEGLLTPYKVSTWDTIPVNMKDSDGYWYGDYYGVISFLINTDVQPNIPHNWPDLLNSEYKGQVALSGDPRTSNQAMSSVFAAALSNGGSLDNSRSGMEFFASLNQTGNLNPIIATNSSVASGETPVRITWDYNALNAKDSYHGNPNTQVVIPNGGQLGIIYVQAISAKSPHPNAAKLWMEFLYSDEGQLLWMKGYCHPVRENDLYARGQVPLDLSTKVSIPSNVVFATPEQLSTAKELITSSWDAIVGVNIQ